MQRILNNYSSRGIYISTNCKIQKFLPKRGAMSKEHSDRGDDRSLGSWLDLSNEG